MTLPSYTALLEGLAPLIAAAAAEINLVYRSDFDHQLKADHSPVTEADIRANTLIVSGLKKLLPNVPVLSEESAAVSYAQRSHWHTYWLVDPLDGTREFIKRNDQFSVNIALIENGKVTLGMVAMPVSGVVYFGVVPEARAARFELDESQPHQGLADAVSIKSRAVDLEDICLLSSRSHVSAALSDYICCFKEDYPGTKVQAVGSSLKLCLLAAGQADLYPKIGPTSEWDIAAGQGVLEAAGGVVWTKLQTPLQFNSKASLINPSFVALADPDCSWNRQVFTLS